MKRFTNFYRICVIFPFAIKDCVSDIPNQPGLQVRNMFPEMWDKIIPGILY